VSTYYLRDPLVILPSPKGNMASSWKLPIEVPLNDPDIFLPAVRLTSLEALRVRLGGLPSIEAMRQISKRWARSVPAERLYHIREQTLLDEHGIYGGFRYWFTDRVSEREALFFKPLADV
jgi:hypothetical protein